MSLIKVKKLDFGFRDNNLQLTIALPHTTSSTESYLTKFEVYTQKDLYDSGDCYIPDGIDYIKAVQRANGDCDAATAFYLMFDNVGTWVEDVTNNIYDLYELKSDFTWIAAQKHGIGIQVYREDFTVIGIELNSISASESFTPSEECGEDSLTCVVPLFDLLPVRLKVLDAIELNRDTCELPKGMLDKFLQLKTLELAIACKEYCKALQYWNLFFNGTKTTTYKSCGCNGKNV